MIGIMRAPRWTVELRFKSRERLEADRAEDAAFEHLVGQAVSILPEANRILQNMTTVCRRHFSLVLNRTVSRIPPESNCMRDRINALILPPSFLVPNAV